MKIDKMMRIPEIEVIEDIKEFFENIKNLYAKHKEWYESLSEEEKILYSSTSSNEQLADWNNLSDEEKTERMKNLYDSKKLKDVDIFPYVKAPFIPKTEITFKYGLYPELFWIFRGKSCKKYLCENPFNDIIISTHVNKYNHIKTIIGTIFIDNKPSTILYSYIGNKISTDKEELEMIFEDAHYFVNNINGIIILKTGDDALDRCKEIQARFDYLTNWVK